MNPSVTARSAILGVPLDPNKQPSGSGVVRAFEQMDARVIANSAGAIIKNSLSNLNAAVSPAAGAMAWVIGDATVGNNGVYENTGTSGSPVWVRRGDLPYGYIHAINVGAGTANAIEVTTAIPIPSADGAAEILVPIVTDNTSTTVTLSINGATALPVKTASGNDPAVGGVTGFMKVIQLGSTYRMLSDQASAAIQAAAEAAQAAAEAAAAQAAAAAGSGFGTVALLVADTDMGYGGGATVPVVVGQLVRAVTYFYRVADSAAIDHDLITAGGVKLYALPCDDGSYAVDAFNPTADGTTEDSTVIKAAVDKAAGGVLRFTPGRSYKFRNIKIENSICWHWTGARVECFFNDAVTGSTERLAYSEEVDDVGRIEIIGGPGTVIDGNYNIAVTVVDEYSVFDFRGGDYVSVEGLEFTECATGAASLATIIFDRSHSLIRIHNAKSARIVGNKARRCRKFEEIWVSSDDETTRYLIADNDSDGIDTTAGTTVGPFSGVSVFNCGPGVVERNTVKNRTVSGFNILSRFATVRGNTGYYFRNAAGTGGSYGIDFSEGLFYAHGSIAENNIVDQCYRAGIAICGNGAQAKRNKTTNCIYGVYSTNILDPVAATYGTWLDATETPIRAMVLEGNHSSDHNSQGSGSNAGGFINSETGFPISATIVAPSYIFGSTSTEYAWTLHGCGTITMQGGHLSDARTALVTTSGTWTGELILDTMELEYDSDGTVHGLLYAAVHKDIIFRNVLFNGTLGASMYDVVRASPGSVNAIRLDGNTRAIDDAGAARTITFSVPANTRRLTNGRIQRTIALTPVSVGANSRQDWTGQTLEGLRAGDHVSVTVTNTGQSVFASNAYQTADNQFRFALINGTVTADTADKSVLVVATEAGFQL